MSLAPRGDAVLRDATQEGLVPGVVAMAPGPQGLLYRGAAGLRDAAADLPMQEDTVFRIASLTKSPSQYALRSASTEELYRLVPLFEGKLRSIPALVES